MRLCWSGEQRALRCERSQELEPVSGKVAKAQHCSRGVTEEFSIDDRTVREK